MSAEVPTPNAERPPARLRVSNRRQMLLFVALTLILTVATVWGGRIWLRNSESLIFAAGDALSHLGVEPQQRLTGMGDVRFCDEGCCFTDLKNGEISVYDVRDGKLNLLASFH